ncbi:hypothetical protein [Burkholderia pseudomallei]|nr:hypothetical protein [Burkholderia pseudomallei]CAJ3076625.1 Uncharacterised protein [Burkholderia pseudomallei]VCK72527.1 Uncharacterised protein [Burkholderia pseudomallei]VCK79865.1 Uncharacterised protein [Burkholderia pseudomallei]VCK80137.1 Uncharacterised protein [Burkholderia pseudomallei]VCK80669.1 Uncharacterised protein [Burkholderia pseudomallei]
MELITLVLGHLDLNAETPAATWTRALGGLAVLAAGWLAIHVLA